MSFFLPMVPKNLLPGSWEGNLRKDYVTGGLQNESPAPGVGTPIPNTGFSIEASPLTGMPGGTFPNEAAYQDVGATMGYPTVYGNFNSNITVPQGAPFRAPMAVSDGFPAALTPGWPLGSDAGLLPLLLESLKENKKEK